MNEIHVVGGEGQQRYAAEQVPPTVGPRPRRALRVRGNKIINICLHKFIVLCTICFTNKHPFICRVF